MGRRPPPVRDDAWASESERCLSRADPFGEDGAAGRGRLNPLTMMSEQWDHAGATRHGPRGSLRPRPDVAAAPPSATRTGWTTKTMRFARLFKFTGAPFDLPSPAFLEHRSLYANRERSAGYEAATPATLALPSLSRAAETGVTHSGSPDRPAWLLCVKPSSTFQSLAEGAPTGDCCLRPPSNCVQ